MARNRQQRSTEDETRIGERQARVSQLYLQGKPQFEIARLVGVSGGTVTLDLQELRERWAEESRELVEAKLAEELAKIDHIERVAWEAWLKSTEDNESKRSRRQYAAPQPAPKRRQPGKPTLIGATVESRRQGQSGDPRFLERIAWCVEMRLRLAGLLKRDEAAATNIVQINWGELTGRPPEAPPVIEGPLPEQGEENHGQE